MYNNALVGLFRSSLEDGRVIEANQVSAEIFGYGSTSELIAEFKAINHYVNPDDRAPVIQELQEKGVILWITLHSKKKDGPEIWNEASFRANIEQGFLECVFIDITERKLAERALQESEGKFSGAFYDSPIPLAILNFETGIREDINTKFTEKFGYSREEMLGGSFIENSLASDPNKLKEGVERVLRGDLEHDFPFKMTTKNGDTLDIILNISRISRTNNLLFIASYLDITERLQAERRVQESEAKIRALFDNAGYAIGANQMGNTTMVNPEYLKLFGYAHESELIGKSLLEQIAPEERERG
mgnify:CR=1 FL=1